MLLYPILAKILKWHHMKEVFSWSFASFAFSWLHGHGPPKKRGGEKSNSKRCITTRCSAITENVLLLIMSLQKSGWNEVYTLLCKNVLKLEIKKVLIVQKDDMSLLWMCEMVHHTAHPNLGNTFILYYNSQKKKPCQLQ